MMVPANNLLNMMDLILQENKWNGLFLKAGTRHSTWDIDRVGSWLDYLTNWYPIRPYPVTHRMYCFPRVTVNKMSQLERLRTMEMCSLRVLKAGSMKSRCQRGNTLWNLYWENPSLPLPSSGSLLAISYIPWLVGASFQSSVFTWLSSLCVSVSVSKSLFFIRTHIILDSLL